MFGQTVSAESGCAPRRKGLIVAFLFAVGLATTLAVNVQGSCVVPVAGLIGWWPGDGSAIDIVGTNNGVLKGGATANAVGLVGQAFSFDGTNGFVQIPDSPVLRPTNLTVEVWVKFDSLLSQSNARQGHQYIVFKQNTQSTGFEGFGLGKDTDGPGGIDHFYFNVTPNGTEIVVNSALVVVTTNVWYHVVGVRGPNFIQLYVNGNFEGQAAVNSPQSYGNFPLYFGTSGQSYWDGKLKGKLDEVSLYNRALSSNEIAAIYVAGAAGKCKAAAGPVITAQPTNQNVVVGSNTSVAVTAAGTAPLSYQWRFNGNNLTNDSQFGGVGSPTLSITNAQPANAGGYSVVVTNSAGSVTSAVAVLTVLVPPAMTAQPQSLTNVTGTTALFSGTATGTAPLSYQWQLNGVNLVNGGRISGATTNALAITNVEATDAGNYTLAVTNSAGSVTSVVAVLTVLVPPVITAQPQNATNVVGTTANFSATATGSLPLSYQWQLNGVNLVNGGRISGATTNALAITNVEATDAGNYTLAVTNSAGSVTSVVAVLTVLVPPVITAQPQSATNVVGTSALFSATATGSLPLSYQWQLNGVNLANGGRIGGATANALAITNVQATDAGNYTLAVTNSAGSVTSVVAVLTVLVPPNITVQPANQNVVAGSNTFVAVTATGTTSLSYQWRFNGSNLTNDSQFGGVDTPTLSITNAQPANAGGYSVEVTNSAGSVTSAVAVLTVLVPPVMTAQPQSLTNITGTTALFGGTATGSLPLSYQWQLNGVNLVNGTSTGVGNTWETGAPMPYLFVEMTSAWLGDRLYVTGMTNAWNPAPTSPMMVYDFLSNTWTRLIPDRTYTGNHHAAEVFGGRLYLIGGCDAGSDGKVQIYDSVVNDWSLGAPMPFAAGACSSAVINGKIYVAGGIVGEIAGSNIGYNTNAAAVYDPASNTWISLAPLPVGMNHTASGTDGTKLYVFGGRAVGNAPDNGYNTVQIYDPTSNTWVSSSDPGSTLAPLPQARGGMGKAIYYNGEFYVMGGETVNGSGATADHVYDRVDIYNVVSNTWRLGTSLPTARHGIYPALRGNRIYVAGGGVAAGVSYSPLLEIYVAANGGRISGAASNVLTITSVQLADAGDYTLVVSNTVGSVTSVVAVLTVLVPPVITAQPQSATNVVGTTANFSATATGSAPLSYQWQLNGLNLTNDGRISGATTNTLTIANVQATDVGNYTLVVSNTAGAITSVVAALAVIAPPVIESIVLSNSVVTITWSAVIGRSYRLQFNEGLASTNWSDVLPDVLAVGPVAGAPAGIGNSGQRFYRVLLVP